MKRSLHVAIQKWAGIVLLCGFVVFSAWAFLVDSTSFEPTQFHIVNGKVTLTGSPSSMPNLDPITWINVANSQTNHWTWDAVNSLWTFDGTAAAKILESTMGNGLLVFPGSQGFLYGRPGGGFLLSANGHNPTKYIYFSAGVLGGDGSGLTNLDVTASPTTINFISTNIFDTFFVTTINSTTVNVSGKARVNYLIVTNQIAHVPMAWSGPSNTLDLSLSTGAEEWGYSTFTPVRITGLTADNGYIERGDLGITNSATTNITITVAAGFRLPASDTQGGSYTLTNGDFAEVLVDYRGDTNGLARTTNIVIRAWH